MVVLWNHNLRRVHQTLAHRYLSLSTPSRLLDLSFLFFLLHSPSFVSSHAQLLSYGTTVFFSQSFSVCLFSCRRSHTPYALTYTLKYTFTLYSQWVIPHKNAASSTLTIYTSSYLDTHAYMCMRVRSSFRLTKSHFGFLTEFGQPTLVSAFWPTRFGFLADFYRFRSADSFWLLSLAFVVI